MKKRFCLILCAVIFAMVHLMPMAIGEPLFDTDTQDKAVDKLFKKYSTIGGALVISYKGEIIYQRYYGYENKKAKEPVTDQTHFRLASISKLVSGIGVMQLVEEGLLDLDAPIGDYLGYTVENLRYKKGEAPITLRQLMTHTASISEYGGFATGGLTLKEMLSREDGSKSNYLKQRPGSKIHYSNFGGGIVGAIMEAVSNQSVNAYMSEHVFEPLGIDAGYSAVMLKDQSHISTIYAADGGVAMSNASALKNYYEDFPDPEHHFERTAGSLWMRPYDLCRLMTALYQGGTTEGVTLLAPQSIEEMCKDQKGVGSVTGKSFYGLFTFRATNLFKTKTVYGHQGRSAGFIANAFYDPEEQLAVVVVTNGADQRQNDRISLIGRAMLRQAYTMLGLDSF